MSLVHIYTGNGKGKTTAAIGQGIRTSGAGYKVLMVQFLKGEDTGELNTIEKLSPNFELARFANMRKFYSQMNDEEKIETKASIKTGIEFIKEQFKSGNYNLIIMDEIMATIYNKIINLDDIISLIKDKPKDMEIIMTGRNAPGELIEIADYVTEMKLVKHPFQKGIYARKGIES